VDWGTDVNWGAVAPDWAREHGTTIVLLGIEEAPDTVLGNPKAGEKDIKGLSVYLNSRFWDLTQPEVTVVELRSERKTSWPDGPGDRDDARRPNNRRIAGAKFYLTDVSASAGKLAASSTLPMDEGRVQAHWYLKIDTVVVYKVDRLTRSLADFAKLVELFDTHSVSFVSITQSFTTSSSMGRLTLNVLLSFAQFERELIGERVRDKIAASKRKGIWVGGPVPLGYAMQPGFGALGTADRLAAMALDEAGRPVTVARRLWEISERQCAISRRKPCSTL
jgi:hypothetical protein